MDISIIVAVGTNNAIGKNNNLLWYLPKDLKRFKKITTGHTIIMGRKTFESIGKPLPNRHSIVITRNKKFQHEGVSISHSIEDALQLIKNEKEVFIIGGGSIYEACLPIANRIYLTTVHTSFEADTFFPKINKKEWQLTSKEEFPKDINNPYASSFEIFERKKINNKPLTIQEMQNFCKTTLVPHLGIEFTEITEQTLSAQMPVDPRTSQPFGFLHGGASLALLETVGSGLSAVHTDTTKYNIFGMTINANHVKPARKGYVHATATFLHKGSRTQVVNVRITDDNNDLVCDGRITNIITEK